MFCPWISVVEMESLYIVPVAKWSASCTNDKNRRPYMKYPGIVCSSDIKTWSVVLLLLKIIDHSEQAK